MYELYRNGDTAGAQAELSWYSHAMSSTGGNFIERFLYPKMCDGCSFGPARPPQPTAASLKASVAQHIAILEPMGFFNQTWHPKEVMRP
jgi:hypothetical protein